MSGSEDRCCCIEEFLVNSPYFHIPLCQGPRMLGTDTFSSSLHLHLGHMEGWEGTGGNRVFVAREAGTSLSLRLG